MKVAIYEPEPRICGPMMWAWQIRTGLRKLGHEAHVVTSTKSGRPSSAWGGEQKQTRGMKNWMHPIDVVVKNDVIVDILNAYDLIIMPDVMNSAQDKLYKKGEAERPWYISVLDRTTTRWISGLHGNFYTETKAPCLGMLMAAGNRSRVMYTNSPTSLESKNEVIRQNTWEPIHLPYELKMSDDYFAQQGIAALPPKRTVGMTGRFIFNKGQPSLAMAASMMDPSIMTEIWGACSSGLGPSPTFVTFEHMIKIDPDSQRKRYGNAQDSDVTGMGGNIVASYTWDFKYTGGQIVRYLGVYSDPVQITRRMGLHLGLTVANFSGGLVEFASLEAMDAGSMSMVLPNISHPDYAQSILPEQKNWLGLPRQIKDMETLRPLADRVNKYLDITDDQRLAIALHNREAVKRNNDPAKVAARIVELAFS